MINRNNINISIERDKIPKNYGFAIKTKQIEELLVNNNIKIHTHLNYLYSKNNFGNIFEAFYWLPNENVPYNRLYIRSKAILKEYIYIARIKMNDIILPKFRIWILDILSLPNNSTYLLNNELCFNVNLENFLNIK